MPTEISLNAQVFMMKSFYIELLPEVLCNEWTLDQSIWIETLSNFILGGFVAKEIPE